MLPELADDRARVAELERQILKANHSLPAPWLRPQSVWWHWLNPHKSVWYWLNPHKDPGVSTLSPETVAEIERTLSALRLQQSAVRVRLDAYKYPVLTLPYEIVAEIFLQFLPEYPSCPPLGGLTSPVFLTHICHLWREIAFATPQLWRAVSLSPRRFPFNPRSVWLSRAGSCPLSIRMKEHRLNEAQLTAAILPYRLRCEYLELLLLLNRDISVLFHNAVFPVLRHLDLVLGFIPLELQQITFHNAPMLRSVVLDVVATRWVVLPWTQLTNLRLHIITLEGCVPILRQTSNLTELNLDLEVEIGVGLIVEIVQPAITLAHLKCLRVTVEGEHWQYCREFLDSFILPALSSLKLDRHVLGDDPSSALMALISRSGCNLQDLFITCPNAEAEYYCLLDSFPSIPEINIQW
ncbi:hypothetical protein R3P38DRAFT_2982949 [Favolaschia claudopus]|uniref:F-box domain-containing protein n=1 Tax=Favolaschia claudopus TaxID=2862362 RepID=A0AAW0B1V4_9AGAR